MKKHRTTIEQARERGRAYAGAFGPGPETERRIAHVETMIPLYREQAATYQELRDTATNRGERWSASYHQKRAERTAAEYEAEAEGLREGVQA
jgi:hypothetical protein